MFPKFYTQTASSHKELEYFAPEGWIQKNYAIDHSGINFFRKVFKFSEGFFLHETEIIEGNVRMEAVHGKDRLQIGFYQSEEYKYLGLSCENIGDNICIISYDQCQWEAVVKAPAVGTTINFDSKLAETLIDKELKEMLREKASIDGSLKGILFRMPKYADSFKTYMQEVLRMGENDHKFGIDLTKKSRQYQKFSEDLIQESIDFLYQVIIDEAVTPSLGEKQRYNLVKSVEALLWRDPVENNDECINLDLISGKLGVSRRNIQSSIKEQMGCGFQELKRNIRLQQLHKALTTKCNSVKINQLAEDYEFFHHGRLSHYYKKLFNETPKETVKKN